MGFSVFFFEASRVLTLVNQDRKTFWNGTEWHGKVSWHGLWLLWIVCVLSWQLLIVKTSIFEKA